MPHDIRLAHKQSCPIVVCAAKWSLSLAKTQFGKCVALRLPLRRVVSSIVVIEKPTLCHGVKEPSRLHDLGKLTSSISRRLSLINKMRALAPSRQFRSVCALPLHTAQRPRHDRENSRLTHDAEPNETRVKTSHDTGPRWTTPFGSVRSHPTAFCAGEASVKATRTTRRNSYAWTPHDDVDIAILEMKTWRIA